MTSLTVAEICHEANRVYCSSLGDMSQTLWEVAPGWQKESAVKGVIFHLDNPGATPEESHSKWLEEKMLTGWRHGTIKDVEKKEHPCIVRYDQLPEKQKVKDKLFLGIVNILRDQVVPQATERDAT